MAVCRQSAIDVSHAPLPTTITTTSFQQFFPCPQYNAPFASLRYHMATASSCSGQHVQLADALHKHQLRKNASWDALHPNWLLRCKLTVSCWALSIALPQQQSAQHQPQTNQ
jgi:hypothetical protein